MFKFEDAARVATAAIGALILSSTLIAAAVGPARAVETAPVQYVQAQEQDRANA